ncbi:hypothetical protein EDF88_4663 [Buttiauxella sp. BIGb0552]|jgi:hypothetical protein|uniref:Uncharacterized protein n=1 Tax=Buttiauxella agrestis TaxID=82977 RepID=A0A381KN51_9ENTR|nr:hypothetical protein EDF88_4663 [Buttiauxella sp. BIGb0552]SUY92790.1 Uncharacterised protein [Buttiauxella agrestis]
MKFGFIIGAIFATWLTLTYPSQMSEYFSKFIEAVNSSVSFIKS